jgi:hypothetical protein
MRTKTCVVIQDLRESSVIWLGLAAFCFFTSRADLFANAVVSASADAVLSADTAGGAFTLLTGPVLDEGDNRDIGTGAIVLAAPSGFAFDNSAVVRATVSRLGGSGTPLVLASTNATVTSNSITITVSTRDGNQGSPFSRITWSGIRVRPIAGTPLASGSILNKGNAKIRGLNGSSAYGALGELSGRISRLRFTTQPGNATAGAAFGAQPVVNTQDQFGNNSTNGLSAINTIALFLSHGAGALQGVLTFNVGINGGRGTAAWSGLRLDSAGNDKQLTVTSTNGWASAISASFAVSPAAASKLAFAVTPPPTALAGVVFTPQPVILIEDAYGNTRSNDTLVVTALRQAGSGTLLGSTNVTAAGGVARFSDLAHPLATNITIGFISGSLTPVTSDSIAVSPGTFTQLQVLLPGQIATPGVVPGRTGTPVTQQTGIGFQVVVNAVDDYWNAVSPSDVVRIFSSDAFASLPPASPLIQGSFNFSLTNNSAGSRTLTAVDLTTPAVRSNTSSAYSVLGNFAPTFPAQTNRTIAELTLLVVTNTATDANSAAQTLTYTLLNPPAGLTIDSAGVIRWTPTEGQGPSTNLVTTVVRDNGTPPLSATNSFTVVVSEINVAPVLPVQADRRVVVLQTLVVTNRATDADIPTNTLSYQLLAPPAGAKVDTNGIITWTPTAAQVLTTNVFTTVVTDFNPSAVNPQHLSATNSFKVTVSSLHNPPVLPVKADVTIAELTTLTVTNTAMATNVPTLGLNYTLLNPPSGALIGNNGVFIWTPSEGQGPSTNALTTVVTDTGTPPLSATNSFTLVVNEINVPPVLPKQADRSVVVFQTLVVTNTATDVDIPANSLSYQLLAAPVGATVNTNGVITWTPTATQVLTTNVFTTVVTDFNPWAVNAQHLSATNSYAVVVGPGPGPVLPFQPDRTVNESTLLTVTNSATDSVTGSMASPLATNTLVFSYVSRDALLADGWSFIATSPDGLPRNTEITNPAVGAVVSYSQTEHPGVMRIPCDFGDLWAGLNDSRNSLFRNLPANWVSLRLRLLFNPVQDVQQAHLSVYQDDDNFIQAGVAFNHGLGGLVGTLVWELEGQPYHFVTDIGAAGDLRLRLDRSLDTQAISGFYALDGAPWNLLGTTNVLLTNPRLCVWVGGSEVPYAPGLPVCDLVQLDIVTSNSAASQFVYQLMDAPNGAVIDNNGVITWTPSEFQGPSTNILKTVVTEKTAFSSMGPPSYLSATNLFQAVVKEVNAPPRLPVQGNLALVSPMSLLVTNTASDPDWPTNVLTYQLTAAPLGAAIDPQGIITWTPAPAQVPSTNLFATVVTDFNPWADINQRLSATNSFTVSVFPPGTGLVLPQQPDRAINELSLLTVTNSAFDPWASMNGEINPVSTNTLAFSYTNRDALFADGWNFIATSPTGLPRDTEIINPLLGAMVSYSQTEHPGVLRIPCDFGDLWGGLNSSRNSLFRQVPTNWITLRLTLAFSPLVNCQQAHLSLYQDDDNFIQAGVAHNDGLGGLVSTLVWEIDAQPSHLTTLLSGTASLRLRLDRNPTTQAISGFYSSDGVSWALLGTANVSLVNPRLGIWVGGSQVPFAAGMPVCDLQQFDILSTNVLNSSLNYQFADAPAGAAIDGNGVITWTPSETQSSSTNVLVTVVTRTVSPAVSATNRFTVAVQEVNSPPILPSQGDKILIGQTTLVVTNTATDADISGVPLSYQLLTAPAGASVDGQGVITWTPSVVQLPSRNPFIISATDSDPPAINATHLSATNSFTVYSLAEAPGPGPILFPVPTQVIDAQTPLVVTNTALDANYIAQTQTVSYPFIYTNRDALLTGGWSFLATLPGGFSRNTEITDSVSGAVASYDQAAHPGLLNIPCDTGDLWSSLNDTRNSLFRPLPPNWLSLRLSLAFAPEQDYQQAHLLLYQDDDNYFGVGLAFNGGEVVAVDQEVAGYPTTLEAVATSANHVQLRLDRGADGTVAAYYSLDGTLWQSLAEASLALLNPRIGIWVGGALVPFGDTQSTCQLERLDVVVSDYAAPPLSYRLTAAPAGASIDSNGVITWTPTQGPGTNVFTTVVADNAASPLSATNTFIVIVNSSSVPPGQVRITINYFAPQNSVSLHLNASGGSSYVLEWAPSVLGPWNPVVTVTADASGHADYVGPGPASTAFFRVRSP